MGIFFTMFRTYFRYFLMFWAFITPSSLSLTRSFAGCIPTSRSDLCNSRTKYPTMNPIPQPTSTNTTAKAMNPALDIWENRFTELYATHMWGKRFRQLSLKNDWHLNTRERTDSQNFIQVRENRFTYLTNLIEKRLTAKDIRERINSQSYTHLRENRFTKLIHQKEDRVTGIPWHMWEGRDS